LTHSDGGSGGIARPTSMMPIVLGIMVIGAVLRLYDLSANSLWTDELRSLTHAAEITSLGNAFATDAVLRTGDAHPPLYFLLLKGWLTLGTGAFTLRLLSAIIGVLTIPATFLLAREVVDRRAAAISSAFVALSPLLLLHDREVRGYALFVFLTVVTTLLFFRAVRLNQGRYWVGFTIAAILNIYTHYHAFLVLASLWVWLLLDGKEQRNIWLKFGVSQVVIAVAYLPWLPVLVAHIELFSTLGDGAPKFPFIWGKIAKPPYLAFSFAVGQTVLPWNWWVVVPAAGVFGAITWQAVCASLQSRVKRQFIIALLITPVVLGILISEVVPRYFVFVFPAFAVFAADGLTQFTRGGVRLGALIVLAIVWSVSIGNYYLGREFHVLATTDPWREVADFIRENRSEPDLLIASGPGRVIGYYVDPPVIFRDEVVVEDLDVSEGQRIWYVFASPMRAEEGESALSVLMDRYVLRFEERFGHDPSYATKARLFKKRFFEYRIRVFLFEAVTPVSTVPS